MLLSFERLEFSFVLSNQSVLSDRLLKQNFLINPKKVVIVAKLRGTAV